MTIASKLSPTADEHFRFLHLTNIANSEPSESQYVDIGKDYRSLWNMPNCVGQSMENMLRFHAPKIQEAHISTIKTFIALPLWRRVTRCALLLPYMKGVTIQSVGGILRNSQFGKYLIRGNLSLLPDGPQLHGSIEHFPPLFCG